MAKQTEINRQTELIRELLGRHPSGLGIEAIGEQSGLNLPRRTLIRRLDTPNFVSDGRGKATVYRLAKAAEDRPEPDAAAFVADFPLSQPALDIQASVRRRRALRKPVGYVRKFLDSYRPNTTSYLTHAERQRLAELGHAPEPGQPAGTHAQQILSRLLIDLSWNSSRLEGNTYSLLDTERLIELGEAAEGKGATEAQMILNHKAAIEFLVQSADEIAINRGTVLNLHALLSENLLPDPRSVGRLRTIAVGIGGSVYHPLAVPQQIAECFDQILATASAIRDPFEQALFMMVQLPYLQPFDDVNKRTSRLAANIPFIRNNLAPISFVDVPKTVYTEAVLGVYELNRVELMKDVFLWAYERSAHRYAAVRQTLGEPDPFRLRHRQALKTVVAEVVKAPMDKKQAARHVAAWAAANIAQPERERFVEIAETELISLHEGNYARYQVRPSEYAAWEKIWTAKSASSTPTKKTR